MIADKNDLLGCEETKKSGYFTKVTLKDKSNVYSLGERVQILLTPESGIIVPYMVEDQNQVCLFENRNSF